jgi:formylmethanofuran dehydrogenase subunit E
MELKEEEVVQLAKKLHGHLAPGIALGMHMC